MLKAFEGLKKQVMIFTGDLHNSYSIEIAPNVSGVHGGAAEFGRASTLDCRLPA